MANLFGILFAINLLKIYFCCPLKSTLDSPGIRGYSLGESEVFTGTVGDPSESPKYSSGIALDPFEHKYYYYCFNHPRESPEVRSNHRNSRESLGESEVIYMISHESLGESEVIYMISHESLGESVVLYMISRESI